MSRECHMDGTGAAEAAGVAGGGRGVGANFIANAALDGALPLLLLLLLLLPLPLPPPQLLLSAARALASGPVPFLAGGLRDGRSFGRKQAISTTFNMKSAEATKHGTRRPKREESTPPTDCPARKAAVEAEESRPKICARVASLESRVSSALAHVIVCLTRPTMTRERTSSSTLSAAPTSQYDTADPPKESSSTSLRPSTRSPR